MILGKSKALNQLHMVRQVHTQKTLLRSSLDWITHPDWQPSFAAFHDKLSELLVEKEDLSLEEASATVKKAFLGYLCNFLYLKEATLKKIQKKASFRRRLKKIPLLEKTYRYLKKNLPDAHKQINLDALLNPNNPYHKEFMAIYNIIATS